MQFLVGTWILVAEDDTTPPRIGGAITQECMHRVEIVIGAFVFARLSHIDGGTGVFGLHELIPIGPVKSLLIVRVDFYFIILIVIFIAVSMCPFRLLLTLSC